MVILIDSREKKVERGAYSFIQFLESGESEERATLKTGDYTVRGIEHRFGVERKSTDDAFGTFGRGRERFMRELERARSFDSFNIVIESSLVGLKHPPRHVEKVTPATVINSLVSWSLDFPTLKVWLACDRTHGNYLTYMLCKKAHEKAVERGLLEKNHA